MEQTKYRKSLATKDLISTAETYNDAVESPMGFPGSRSNELRHRKTPISRSKRHFSKRRNKNIKRHSSSSKQSKDNYESCLESKSEDEDHFTHKGYVR